MEPILVALPDVVLTTLGEQLLLLQGSRKTLQILAGLSRRYRRIFAPLLFSRIVVNQCRNRKLTMGELGDPPYLSSVKQFGYDVDNNVEPDDDEFERPHLILRILPQMHNLTSFEWGVILWTMGSGGIRGLNLPLGILKMLQRECPKLRHLSLNLGRLDYYGGPDHWMVDKYCEEARWADRNELQVPLFDVRGFRNLTTLDILGIYGNLKTQARNLGVVLAENPQLCGLSLSIQASAIPQDEQSTRPLDEPTAEHNLFCTWMCDEFSDRRKQEPLSLRRLHLGKPITINAADFARLTKRQLLEQLFQYSGPIGDNHSSFYLVPDMMVFSYDTCPALWEISMLILGGERKLKALLNSWPKIEVDGVQVGQWDRVKFRKTQHYLIYRRSRAVPVGHDDRVAPRLDVWGIYNRYATVDHLQYVPLSMR